MTGYTPPPVGLIPAEPVITVTEPNPVYGGMMTVNRTTRNNDATVAVSGPGDDFPRWLLTADGFMWFGNGTFDPYTDGGLSVGPNGDILRIRSTGPSGTVIIDASTLLSLLAQVRIAAASHQLTISDGSLAPLIVFDGGNVEFLTTDHGPILHAPDNTKHRVNVDNAGVLSTTVVP